MRRKYAGNVRFGIVFIVMGSIVATIMTIAISFLAGSIKEFEDKGWDSSNLLPARTTFSLIVLAIMTASVFVVGIYMLARGLIGQKVKRNGKKSSCTITQLRYRRRYRASDSFSVIARYKGASGKEYEYVSATTFNQFRDLREGMRIECYILGEECYVDEKNIKVIDKTVFDEDEGKW